MKANLRHLRVFLAVVEHSSITRAADACHVSQPAVTQTIRKLEADFGAALFQRTPQGLYPTEAGQTLAGRVQRAFDILDPALADLAPRLRLTATTPQLHALIAMTDTENFTLAARRLGLAQPTVHRAITQLEKEADRALFQRTTHGMIPTRPASLLAQSAELAFAELAQGEADLAELAGREVGRIVIGAMPLSRSYILPRAIARFRERRPSIPIQVLDGPYDDLVTRLRRGEADMLIGALRQPAPIADVVQERLFDDELAIIAGSHHPLLKRDRISLEDLGGFPWVVAGTGTPTRGHFDTLFAPLGAARPRSLVETSSMALMRELLKHSDHLGFISRLQIRPDLELGALTHLPYPIPNSSRPIGLTTRADWVPTKAQADFREDIRAVVAPRVAETGDPIRSPVQPAT